MNKFDLDVYTKAMKKQIAKDIVKLINNYPLTRESERWILMKIVDEIYERYGIEEDED